MKKKKTLTREAGIIKAGELSGLAAPARNRKSRGCIIDADKLLKKMGWKPPAKEVLEYQSRMHRCFYSPRTFRFIPVRTDPVEIEKRADEYLRRRLSAVR